MTAAWLMVAAMAQVPFSQHAAVTQPYSIWAMPDSVEWTLIFSRAADVFHIPYPGESHDALRIKVKPLSGPYFETLAFYFRAADAKRALLTLHWGETLVQVPIENTP